MKLSLNLVRMLIVFVVLAFGGLILTVESSAQSVLPQTKMAEFLLVAQERKQELDKRMSQSSSFLERERWKEELNDSNNEYVNWQLRYINFIAHQDLEFLSPAKKQVDKKLTEEVEDLTRPLISSLRRISKRPRLIESLLKQEDELRQALTAIEESVDKLSALKFPFDIKKVEEKARDISVEFLEGKKAEKTLELQEVLAKLEFENQQNKSVTSAISDLIKGFWSRTGVNFFWAFVIFFGTFALFIFLRREGKAWMERKGKMGLAARPLAFFYTAIAIFTSFLFTMSFLYLRSDWVLLTFFIFLLISIFWSGKNLVPKYLKEIKLILNLGNVKQGEVIKWQGILWRVAALGPVVSLRNESVQKGGLKLPLSELHELYSHPLESDRALFPCREGDYVELARQTKQIYGQVKSIGIESVQLQQWDGGMITLSMENFLGLSPENFSLGFSLKNNFTWENPPSGPLSEGMESLAHQLRQSLEAKLSSWVADSKLISEGITLVRIDCAKNTDGHLAFSFLVNLEGELANALAPQRFLMMNFIETFLVEKK